MKRVILWGCVAAAVGLFVTTSVVNLGANVDLAETVSPNPTGVTVAETVTPGPTGVSKTVAETVSPSPTVVSVYFG